MLKPVETTCMDISDSTILANYGHLPKDKIYEWAAYQAALSVDYARTKKGSSYTPTGAFAKRAMLKRLEEAFLSRGNAGDWSKYSELFAKHLEDPGTLENFRYFCVPDSDEMIMFYKSIWTGDMASAMEYLHRWGKDLKGNYRKSPEDESWYRMTEFEGIAVNERLKAKAISNLFDTYELENVCFFGGGNLPERLYNNCLYGANITLFETGTIVAPEDLANNLAGPDSIFEKYLVPENVTIYRENLLQAATHEELVGVQDLVVMHGVSMYLGKNIDGMVCALKNALMLLCRDGLMSYDYLLLTDGMKRTATAQHWPGAENMKIFSSVEEAIAEGKETIRLANEANRCNDTYFDVENITINSVEPWGETSVRFLLRKCL